MISNLTYDRITAADSVMDGVIKLLEGIGNDNPTNSGAREIAQEIAANRARIETALYVHTSADPNRKVKWQSTNPSAPDYAAPGSPNWVDSTPKPVKPVSGAKYQSVNSHAANYVPVGDPRDGNLVP